MPAASRRRFLQTAALSVPGLLTWPGLGAAAGSLQSVRFALCADVHQDVMHDGVERLNAFVDHARKERVGFILQLGDFCRPEARNRSFIAAWEQFAGPRHHTLGNHDNDGGHPWPKVMDFWKMPRRYYSFDQGGWHFVVLDGNELNPGKRAAGYPRFVGREQLDWLADDLAATGSPTLVFSHQGLEHPDGVENGESVRAVLAAANARAGWRKVGACFSGHHHLDSVVELGGIHYVQINSMSYYWVGDKYRRSRYGAEVEREHPSIQSTAPYRDPLFGVVTLSPSGTLSVAGRRSEFVGPSPGDLGVPQAQPGQRDQAGITARISDRKLPISVA